VYLLLKATDEKWLRELHWPMSKFLDKIKVHQNLKTFGGKRTQKQQF
jgi:hypothetical protein